MRTALLVANQYSGKAELKLRLLHIVDRFNKAGWRLTVHISQFSGDITGIVKKIGGEHELVIACGGDGTLNETVEGLMSFENPPLLGYIPSGTINDFAESLRLPKDMRKAADIVVTGEPFKFDVGQFNKTKFFTDAAAFGAITDISYQTPQPAKNALGRAAYVFEGLRQLANIENTPTRIEYEGGVVEDDLATCLVTNNPFVAGLEVKDKIYPLMNDGLFEVTLVKRIKNVIDLQRAIGTVLEEGPMDRKYVYSFKARSLKITTETPVRWTLDGEYGGLLSQVEIENLCNRLSVIVDPKTLYKLK